MNHPIQPLVVDSNGRIRFKENKIVTYLLDSGTCDMNKLAILPFSQEDREQFAQLIGYSVCGYLDLSYVSDATAEKAIKKYDKLEAKLLKKEKNARN